MDESELFGLEVDYSGVNRRSRDFDYDYSRLKYARLEVSPVATGVCPLA